MKNLFIVMTVLFSANVFACELPEAQFTGKVSAYDKSDCTYRITYTEYNESGVCGLHKDDADFTYFRDTTCKLKVGDEVSGFMLMNEDGTIVIE